MGSGREALKGGQVLITLLVAEASRMKALKAEVLQAEALRAEAYVSLE